MKTTITITINNLPVEFSDAKPTKPGAYWWVLSEGLNPHLVNVISVGRLYAQIVGQAGASVLADWCGLFSTSPLVPATEVEKAWDECAALGSKFDGDIPGWEYEKSNARRIVEGTV